MAETGSPPRFRFLVGALERPTMVLMILVSILVVGVIAFQSIPLQLMPGGVESLNEGPPSLSVRIPVPESTPTEVMEQVAEPAEELMRGIPGVRRIQSISGSDACRLEISYGPETNVDVFYSEIRDRMERLVPSLPEGADRYRIFRFNLETDFPIVQAAVSYDESVRDPEVLLENVIAKKIEAIDGVARVRLRGVIDERLEIELDPDLIDAYQIDVRRLIERLRGDNTIAPGGKVDLAGQSYLLRVNSRFQTIEDVEQFPVNDSLRLGDIATIERRRGLQNFLVRVNGDLCKTVVVSKEADANTIETCERVLATIDALPADPRLAGFDFFPFMNQAEMITESTDALQQSCLWGGIIAIAVLYLFLRRLALTILIAVAIPLSLTIAVIVIYFVGGSFNMISITGLTLGIGMLIDNAIVIAENIFRLRTPDRSPVEAASRGVREVALAVTLGTLTTVVVFVPVIFMGRDPNMRVMLGEVGLPVCYSVLASLFVALIFMPLATTYFKNPRSTPGSEGGGFENGRLQRIYASLLSAVLRQRLAAVLVLIGVLVGSVMLAKPLLVGKEAAQRKTRFVGIEVEFPAHFLLADADEAIRTLRTSIAPLSDELHVEDVVEWFGSTGGTLFFVLEKGAAVEPRKFLALVKPHLPVLPGVRLGIRGADTGERSTKIEARGEDPAVLRDLLEEVAIRVRDLPDVISVRTTQESSPDEIRVGLQREQAQRYQVNPSTAAMLVGWALRGAPLPDFEADEGELAMWISYAGSDDAGIESLAAVNIFSETGGTLPLVNLADFEVDRGLPSIRRVNGVVSADLEIVALAQKQGPASEVAVGPHGHSSDGPPPPRIEESIAEIFASLEVPEGYELVFDRGFGDTMSQQQDFMEAGALAVVLIFVLMGVLFESFLLPLAVLFTVPFMFIGAIWALILGSAPLFSEAMVGFIILLGVVVNNAIVLVDTIQRFTATAVTRTQAVLAAARARIRPVLMTASTTICGLTPLIFQEPSGNSFDYRPLALVVMGGLITSTAFTLIVAPLAYTLLDDLRTRLWAIVSPHASAPQSNPPHEVDAAPKSL